MSNHAPFKECVLSKRRPEEAPRLSSRLPSFIGAHVEAEAALRNLCVAVIGVGSVGMRIAIHLARLQIGELWLVDTQRSCKPESVLTHPVSVCFKQPKATVAARHCKKISPSTRVFSFVGQVQNLPLDALADVHICVMATDNLAAEIEVGNRCVHLGKRLVHAALHGESMTTQVRVFANTDAQGPCPACTFGAVEWQQLSDQVQFSCDGRLSGRAAQRISGPPTRSTSHLCSMAADLAINQILRQTLQLGNPVENTVVEYCGITNQTVTSQLERNPNCRCDHTRFRLERSLTPLKAQSFEQVAKEFGFDTTDSAFTLKVGGAIWIEKGLCQCGPDPVSVQKFILSGQGHVGTCARCRSHIRVQPFYARDSVSAAVLGKAVATPLMMLGALKVPWLFLRNNDRAILVQDPARAIHT
jgi:molybdopterin/thiamine biosynthesis adenylyltransferase